MAHKFMLKAPRDALCPPGTPDVTHGNQLIPADFSSISLSILHLQKQTKKQVEVITTKRIISVI